MNTNKIVDTFIKYRNKAIELNAPEVEKLFKWLDDEFAKLDVTTEDEIKKAIDSLMKEFSTKYADVLTVVTSNSMYASTECFKLVYNQSLHYEQLTIDYLKKYGTKKVKSQTKTVSKIINSKLQKGIENGDAPKKIISNIKATTENMKGWKARQIYRTETHSAYSSGGNSQLSRLEMDRKWIHVGGGLTDRANHKAIDGEVVKPGKKYSIGLLHPHDQSAAAKEIINCYCIEIGVI